jgi:hypothetical protein
MEEKQSLDQSLGEVRPVVPAAKMCKFVQEDLIHLVRRQFFHDPVRKNHDR